MLVYKLKKYCFLFCLTTLVSFAQTNITESKIIPVISLLLLGGDAVADTQKALINGVIHTVNPSSPTAQAVLIDSGLIKEVGTTAQIMAAADDDAKIVDLQGKLVLPGFQDAHLHAAEAGFNELLCFLSEQETLANYKFEIADCAADQADLPWVLASGVYVAGLIGSSQLPIEALDEVVPNKPVLILDNLGHGAWANTKAMQTAGYLSSTGQLVGGQPQGGIIHIDQATNKVSGILFENAQQKLRAAAVNAVDADLSIGYQGLLNALPQLAKNGITTVSDAGGYWNRGDHSLWSRALQAGKLTVRASNAFYVFPDKEINAQITQLNSLFSNNQDSLLRFNQAKIYVDGILSLGTAALYAPYAVIPEPEIGLASGFEYFANGELNRYVTELELAGYQIHFHATGDRGTGLALDAIQAANTANNLTDRRHRVTHMFLSTAADRARFASQNVVADFQVNPGSVTADYRSFINTIVGSARAANLLVINSMLNTGAAVTLSSDWDAGPLPVLGSIERVLTRSSEAVPDVATAVKMATLDTAFLLHHDDKTGSIEVGKYADIIVLDKNIFTIPVTDIDTTKVLATLLGGQAVYDSAGLF